MVMTNNRPYITRALYEWIVDNNCTPYILVDSHWPSVVLPAELADEEKIVLNISPIATRDLAITNEQMTFLTRFDGETFTISLPINAILAIYAQENGQGMVFDPEPYPEDTLEESNDVDLSEQEATPLLSISSSDQATPQKSTVQSEQRPPKGKGKPSLKVVK